MEWVTLTAQSTVILLFFCGIFNYVILKPLNATIKSLKDAIKEMRKDEKEREEKRQHMDVRLGKVEASTKLAHHRIDHLEEAGKKV